MAYDNIREAKYIAPSGATFVLQFDEVERSGGKKSSVHELPQQNDPIVQDLGNQASKYPLNIYFTGADCYTLADALYDALSEIGPGTLEHPTFGNLEVLATNWNESRKLVDGLGRVDFKIDFVRAPKLDSLSVSTPTSIDSTILEKAQTTVSASVAKSAGKYAPETAAETSWIKEKVSAIVSTYKTTFEGVTSFAKEAQTEINKIVREVSSTIDTLVTKPLELYTECAAIAQIPAQVSTKVLRKIEGYREQILFIAGQVAETYTEALTLGESLFYALAGTAAATVEGTISSRTEAITVASTVEEATNAVIQAIEKLEETVPEYRADPETFSALVSIAILARDNLVEKAYSLRAERRLTLATERTPLDLLVEFYGDGISDLDAALDEFVEINVLVGDEIILIPAGREVVYYA